MIRLYELQKKEKAASHLSNAFSMGYFEELPLRGQYKQEAFWRDYALLVKYRLGRIRLGGPTSKQGMHIHQGHDNKVRFI